MSSALNIMQVRVVDSDGKYLDFIDIESIECYERGKKLILFKNDKNAIEITDFQRYFVKSWKTTRDSGNCEGSDSSGILQTGFDKSREEQDNILGAGQP